MLIPVPMQRLLPSLIVGVNLLSACGGEDRATLVSEARAMLATGDSKPAFAEQALKLQPDNPAVMDTLGWILVQLGQTERGIKLLQQALTKAPDAAGIQYHLASSIAKTGDRGRAQSELDRLLASGVAFPREREACTLLKQLQGKTR